MRRLPAAWLALLVTLTTLTLTGCRSAAIDEPAFAPALVLTPDPAVLSCTVGDTVTVALSVTNAVSPPKLTFASRGPQIALTPGTGAVTVACAQAGESAVLITATTRSQRADGAVPVTVSPAPPLTVTLKPAELACRVGETVEVTAAVDGDAPANATIAFIASNERAVVAATSGTRATISCVSTGLVTLTASATAGVRSGSASVPITVSPPPPLVVAVQPAALACHAGETAAVTASVEGNTSPRVSVAFSTSSAHAVVAGVSGTAATVRCVSTGLATLTVDATAGPQSGAASVAVTVSPPPQTVVLFATPKFMAAEFAAPEAAADRFLAHYAPLTTRAAETIVIFAVGNSQHILTYKGAAYGRDTVAWARYTDGKKTFDQILRYDQLGRIVRAFKERGAARGLKVKVYDQIDPGNEMAWESWKFDVHPECMDMRWISFDIRGRLKPDTLRYASAPGGAPAGKLCGEFIADQVAAYMRDYDFDGILYGNQFGTRGRWLPDSGDGYSGAEAAQIKHFLEYSRAVYGARQIMWFDSYNNVKVEHDTWSFPSDAYGLFDYIMASGFCVITETPRYVDDLESKLALPNRPKIIATLDYVDPWYTYNSMTWFPDESKELENVAVRYRDRIDGLVFFANDERGALVPADMVASFAQRFWDVR